MTKLIELNDVSVRYGACEALSHVYLDIHPQDFLGIIGPNGGGKTTLVKAILKAVPYTGKVIYSKEIESGGYRRIGYMPQISDLDKTFPISVREVVLSGLQARKKLFGRYTSADREKAENLLRICGIESVARRPIGALSGGQLQRALLGRALISDPKLLILDEPTLGLDVMSREAMLEELQEYLDSEGTGGAPRSVLISSHISSDLEKFCDDIYMIDRGKIVLHEETDVLLDSYGILKVDERQYQALDRRYLLAGMREAYGYRLLTNERRYYQENYPDLVMEKGSIDDILILTARGEKL